MIEHRGGTIELSRDQASVRALGGDSDRTPDTRVRLCVEKTMEAQT